MEMDVTFSDLLGKTLTRADGAVGDGRMVFEATDGSKYAMDHSQDCCEHVSVEDICGDMSDLIGAPILLAEESTSDNFGEPRNDRDKWTFYKLATIGGSVDIRWHGSSNGYYGVSVDFVCTRGPFDAHAVQSPKEQRHE